MKTFTINQYSDDWSGCSKLIADLCKYYYECFLLSKKSMSKLPLEHFIRYRLSDETKINPAFYPLISLFLGRNESSGILSEKWKKMFEVVRDISPEQSKENSITQVDTKNQVWTNINSLYPNYEDKGTIAITDVFTEDRFFDAPKSGKGNYITNSLHDWSSNIENVLNIIKKFSNNQFDLKAHEHRAIKYIAGEILANTFQHAFKNGNGHSGLGIFLSNGTREITMVIIDKGWSIPTKVGKKVKSLTDSQAIAWALQRGNTTKPEETQGGIGLYRISKIINLAKGEFAFRSKRGEFYSNDGKISRVNCFTQNLGTIFYMKLDLSQLQPEHVKMEDTLWDEVKEIFL